MWLYATTIFLSALLLFQVQLVLAKHILPWFGGVPAVWTTCLVFFQCALLAGYAWAHWLDRRSLSVQRALHLALLAAAVGSLIAGMFGWGTPLLPGDGLRPAGAADPVWQIVELLALAVALPFLTLAATAPLLQRWFSLDGRRGPWRLYAVSNLGSLAGLLGYPFLIEVLIPLPSQAWWWAAGYLLFALGIAAIALRMPVGRRRARPAPAAGPRPAPARYALWFALAACASVLLISITSQITQEIAPVPLLWVAPLALYLLSFVLCFESDRWYVRDIWLALLVPLLALATLAIQHGVTAGLVAQVVLYLATLFVACMVCHGELARSRPAPRHLTAFYLTLTAGGAAGGLFAGLVAPRLFPAYWELPLALWACGALALGALARDRSSCLYRGGPGPVLATFAAAVLLVALVFAESLNGALSMLARSPLGAGYALLAAGLAVLVYVRRDALRAAVVAAGGALAARLPVRHRRPAMRTGLLAASLLLLGATHIAFALDAWHGTLAVARNFFGVLKVTVRDDERTGPTIRMQHGRTLHGQQALAPEFRLKPNGYYEDDSGVARALTGHARRRSGEPMRIGVVGLGTGTLAVFGRAGDHLRFYEINPQVIRLARGPGALFSYLRDSAATVEIVTGDGRIALESERAQGALQDFDVLALDAFNSDSIPVHLLTREALELYLAHLAPGGVLAVHVSNRYLDLEPLLARMAGDAGLAAVTVETDPAEAGDWASRWVLLARGVELLPAGAPAAATRPGVRPWTDQYSNLLAAFNISADRTEGPGADGRSTASTLLDLER